MLSVDSKAGSSVEYFSLITFSDVPESYSMLSDVVCSFTRALNMSPESADYVGIFLVGWQSVEEYVCSKPVIISAEPESTHSVTFPGMSLSATCYTTTAATAHLISILTRMIQMRWYLSFCSRPFFVFIMQHLLLTSFIFTVQFYSIFFTELLSLTAFFTMTILPSFLWHTSRFYFFLYYPPCNPSTFSPSYFSSFLKYAHCPCYFNHVVAPL